MVLMMLCPTSCGGCTSIEVQGYEVTYNILYQDNKSTTLLAKNGRWSSSKRTKHNNNRCFLVKDKIDHGELEVQYCGIKEMWSDVLTKPLQGRAYCEMRSNFMNCPVDYDDDGECEATHRDLLPEGAGPTIPKNKLEIPRFCKRPFS